MSPPRPLPGPAAGEHRARKRFGQHFLHDPVVVRRIIDAVSATPRDTMVEIGPGTGVMTTQLLASLDRLHVVEIDRDLAAELARRFADASLTIHQADALRFDFGALSPAPGALRVVGNLPYNISTPLLFHLLEQRDALKDMHFMLQQEVVTRMAAAPGGKDYGRLSVMVQFHCEVTPLFHVGPGAFRPPPRVDSAVVRLVPHPKLALPSRLVVPFGQLVKKAFAQRRKTLRNALRGLLEPRQLESAGVDPGSRAETLSIDAFVALARQVQTPDD